MRKLTAIILAGLLIAPAAFAADGDSAPLPAGKVAGLTNAQSSTATAVKIGLAAGLIGLGIAAIASGGKAGGCASLNTHTPCGGSTPPDTTGSISTTTST